MPRRLLILLLALSACSFGDPEPFQGDVDIRAEQTGVRFANNSNRRVHYAAVEVQGMLDGKLRGAGTNGHDLLEQNPLLLPGRTVLVRYADVLFFDDGDQDVFATWRTELASTGNAGAERIVRVGGDER